MSNTKKQILLVSFLLMLTLVALSLIHFGTNEKNFWSFNIFSKNENTLKTVFLDIGQGDATLLEFPDKTQMLVDCSKDRRILNALGRNMKFWDRTIDYVLISHPDRDHYGGCLDVIKRFHVKKIFYTGFEKKGDSFWEDFWSHIQSDSRYEPLSEGKKIQISGVDVEVLSPAHRELESRTQMSNETSIVLKIVYGHSDLLLMADAEMDVEKRLMEQYGNHLDVEVLKVGHHGSAGATSEAFLQATTPRYAVISVGQENPYGHPTQRVLKKLERSNANILRTDQKGDIIMYVENGKIYVK
ncbi:MAG: hypothetical protein COV59_01995 [Candidatus Magasanikbacteria bacterium CG11_big_fil_rev_8_21_14_0_20_39_34]|uniref:Metallo-beta-lactamase domain-containing protein n=1 Tax=Candidatus Magasanikbacteria bacterium CG11_big_fil_rev_8_21_14_0_20_39_34 TaxID=1974653 RepID=A0A2H0N4W0_9BACT|nr:MAG: hypothetical protein COV59_01995 [Candidatus Magasanikbacteria bacterium CG11_big_fil_rev_8_21_14_0_20_39_34]